MGKDEERTGESGRWCVLMSKKLGKAEVDEYVGDHCRNVHLCSQEQCMLPGAAQT